MKLCPLCSEAYADDSRFCPNDGSLLVGAKDPYIGKLLMDQFEIREVCGRGSMGTVYRAWQTSMEREVAIKVLRRDLMRNDNVVKRFNREARAVARLSHPNIIVVYVVGEADDGVPFLAMEFVKGRSLATVCNEEAPLPPVQAIHIASQITSALSEAHGQDVIHRDLKPENIHLASKSQTPDFVKVLDFGIAKILRGNDESMLTQTGAIFGTPHYLAPEQASGSDIDHRCDLYALGVILYQMVVGQLPFAGDTGMGVLVRHIKEPPPRPRSLNRGIPQPLEDLILKALEKDPDDRFQSAEEMGGALEAVVQRLQSGKLGLERAGLHSGVIGPASVTAAAEGPGAAAADPASEPDRPPEPDPDPGPAAGTDPAPEVTPEPGIPDTLQAAGAEDQDSGGQQPARSLPPVVIRPTPAPGGLSTIKMARKLLGHRRMASHLVLGALMIAGGAFAGVFYWERSAAPPPPESPSRLEPGIPRLTRVLGPDAGPDLGPDATPPPARKKQPSKKPSRRKKRPTRASPSPRPVPGPAPVHTPDPTPAPRPEPASDHGEGGSDHAESSAPRPASRPPAADRKAEGNEEIYELVD